MLEVKVKLIYTIRVIDAQTKAPIGGAYLMLICNFPGGGTVPWDGYTNSEGYATIDTGATGAAVMWSATASGYISREGTSSPPSVIELQPEGVPPIPVENLAVIVLPALVGAGTVAIGILLR